jgi:hypothetical protein
MVTASEIFSGEMLPDSAYDLGLMTTTLRFWGYLWGKIVRWLESRPPL